MSQIFSFEKLMQKTTIIGFLFSAYITENYCFIKMGVELQLFFLKSAEFSGCQLSFL